MFDVREDKAVNIIKCKNKKRQIAEENVKTISIANDMIFLFILEISKVFNFLCA